MWPRWQLARTGLLVRERAGGPREAWTVEREVESGRGRSGGASAERTEEGGRDEGREKPALPFPSLLPSSSLATSGVHARAAGNDALCVELGACSGVAGSAEPRGVVARGEGRQGALGMAVRKEFEPTRGKRRGRRGKEGASRWAEGSLA